MKLIVSSVDYAPKDLHAYCPITVHLIRQLPGPDRPDYWIGALEQHLSWIVQGIEKKISHVIVAARWQGTQIGPDFKNLPIALAYITDEAQLDEQSIDFSKCKYVAIGIATVVNLAGRVPPLKKVISGRIAPGFGTGKSS